MFIINNIYYNTKLKKKKLEIIEMIFFQLSMHIVHLHKNTEYKIFEVCHHQLDKV